MSRGKELVTMDFLGIDKTKNKASKIKYCTPGIHEKSIHWIKPQMVHQAFWSRGLCEEYCKASKDSLDSKFEAASRMVKELFPQISKGCGSNPTGEQNNAIFGNSSVGRSAYTTSFDKPSNTQLMTIFYNGTVNVYDVVEKQAEDIISFAGNEKSSQQLHSAGFNSHADPPKPITVSSTSTNNQTEPLPLNPSKNSTLQQIVIQKLHTDLPQQRKESLQRFLQNRKEYRISRAAPYNSHNSHAESLLKKAVN